MGLISINKVSDEIKNLITEDYKNNISIREIERRYSVSRATISKYLEKIGEKTLKGNHYRKYKVNDNYFEKINSEEKAYWLGFLFADGYISNKTHGYGQDKVGLCLAETDKEMVELFKKSIEAENLITIDCSKKSLSQYRLLITSQKMVNDLIDKGCYKKKSLILEPPKNVPEDLIHHFIRGFFDGDGSIIKTKKENLSRKTNGYIYSINITSTEKMVYWLQDYFQMGSVIKESRREQTYYYTLGGHLQVIKFYNILYKDATIFLKRKYNRFQELVQKYSEN